MRPSLFAAYFGIVESPGHVPNENRIAFWLGRSEDVDRVADVARKSVRTVADDLVVCMGSELR
jgi:hypothetical protein